MPAQVPLDLYRGDSARWVFEFWTDLAGTVAYDLTGATPKSEIRTRSDTPVLATLACTVTPPNTVEVVLDAVVSATLISGAARWDLQLTFPDGTVRTLVAGPVTITADITDSGMLARAR
jgi:hypothetical protein